MITRRLLIGSFAATTASGSAPLPRRSTAKISPVSLGALSALEVLPERLRAGVLSGDGTADLAPYLNEAIKSLAGAGGTLYFPAGTYLLSSLDLTQSVPSEAGISLIGAGREQTILRGNKPGSAMVDASGRNNLSLVDLQIQGGSAAPACGVLLARLKEKPQCQRNRFQNIRVRGSFAVASVVSASAESNSWLGCVFENSHRQAAYQCFLTTNNLEGLALPPHILAGTVAGPNTDNVMTDCEFYAPFDGAAPVHFVGSAGYTMLGCTVIAGSASRTRLVTYSARESIFSGPITWHNPHLEVFGQQNVVHCLEGLGICYYRGINSYSGNYQVGENTLLLGQDPKAAGRPILQNTTWTVPLISQGVKQVQITVYAIMDTTLAIRAGNDVGDVVVDGFAVNSHVAAAHLRVAQTVLGATACI